VLHRGEAKPVTQITNLGQGFSGASSSPRIRGLQPPRGRALLRPAAFAIGPVVTAQDKLDPLSCKSCNSAWMSGGDTF
jgi:hypothetical protein